MDITAPLYGLVIEEVLKPTKDGRSNFHMSVLKTTVGEIQCFMWDAPGDATTSPSFPHPGDIIEVTKLKYQPDRGNVVIYDFKRIAKEDLPDPSICEFEKASEEEMKHALDLITDCSFWENRKNHDFTMACLADLDKAKLKSCPAASHIHHTYGGGLIVHTAEVLELCRSIVESCERYSFINRDVLYAGAILHDIGKVETYYVDDIGVIKTLPTEKMIGHIVYGMNLVFRVADKKKVDKDFLNELLHCIASHHGLIEWGSLKVCQSVEAGMLSRVDYISSRNGMIEKKLKSHVETKQPLTDEFKVYGDPYFASIGMKKYVGEK